MNKVNKKVATVEAMLYRFYTAENGSHPVKIRVTWQRKPRYYPVLMGGEKLFLTGDEYMVELAKTKSKIKDAIRSAEAKAKDAKNTITHHDIKPFSFSKFQKEYLNQESEKGMIAIWEKNLSEILKENRIGTYKAYRNALSAFKNFRQGKEIMPEDITIELLKDFEGYLRKEKEVKTKSGKIRKMKPAGKTSVGMYMRALKANLNIAISDNPSLAEFYPFATKQSDKRKYKIKSGSGHKGEALSLDDLQAFINLQPIETSAEWEAKLYWLFSFYSQGMNFRDIFHLRYQNVNWDAMRYVRKKTEGTEAQEEQIEVPLSDQIKDIIVKMGNADKRPSAYVFPLLGNIHDPIKQDDSIRQKIKTTNKWLKKLCEAKGLPAVTTYWARHSYASLLKASGESIEMIRELLGHSDSRTTEAYLKRFDLSKKQEVNDRLHATLKAS